ncbi:MAG: hypothetical protein KJ077_11095 [Anaerolineae bacterium]|nr:hypothetical protein [Anaerolineae bacterium]
MSDPKVCYCGLPTWLCGYPKCVEGVASPPPESEALAGVTAPFVLKTGAICSECKPERAQAVARLLRERGWPIRYGGLGRGSVLPQNNPTFSADFYAALDEVDHGIKMPAAKIQLSF